MLFPHISWKTLPADLLHLCSQFSSAVSRGNQRWQCPDCTKTVSGRQDLNKHMKIHAKAAENYLVCSDCPVVLLQEGHLDGHRLRHHSGNEKYKCKDSPDCIWGGSTEDALTAHRRKYHGKISPYRDSVSIGTCCENEPTVDPSPSPWTNDFDTPANSSTHGEMFMDRSTASASSNGVTPFDGPTQVTPRKEEIFFWTSPAPGFQRGDPRYSPEAKQLYPAASAGPLDDGLDSISPLGGKLEEFGTGTGPFINTDPLRLMADAMEGMNALNRLVPAEAPAGPRFKELPIDRTFHVFPTSSSWNKSEFGTV
ncbi:uncharacterized protein EV420DRAFT_1509285 [Desarmillaria tabescens]|uniref:C2H2-type domain-containing protein n=1 Tax=Armillaria tabescens TaxID=1929756 RepID=A0AA39NI05_ARMTA|nr:uncharacterized protein EV420DRAFT_1509285 [Desarmillaria tabescens]KAK0466008.1 hypothetical protein EV420DRAFT_1509285 [Desarmillaria tabescens]